VGHICALDLNIDIQRSRLITGLTLKACDEWHVNFRITTVAAANDLLDVASPASSALLVTSETSAVARPSTTDTAGKATAPGHSRQRIGIREC